MNISGGNLGAHHLFRIKFTELNEIYAVMTMRSFIVSLIGIFVPIYLWNLHFSLVQILIIYILMYLGEALLEIPTALFIAKFGPKHLIAVSMPILVAHFLILASIPIYHWPIWVIAFSASIAMAFFWQPYHWDFSRCKHSKEAAKELSAVMILSSIAGALAPFAGGYLATKYGVGYVFALVAFFLVFAILPLFATSEPHTPTKLKFSRLKIKKIKTHIVAYSGMAAHGIVGLVVWPLLVFFILKTYQSVGLVTSIASIFTLIATYYLGKTADQGKKQIYLKSGSYLMSLTWFLKMIASSFIHIFSLDFLSNIANSLFYSSFVSEYYLHADEESRSEYLTVMEITSDLGRTFTLILLLFATLYFSDKAVLVIGLILAGIGSLVMGIMPPTKEEAEIMNKDIRVFPMIRKKVEIN